MAAQIGLNDAQRIFPRHLYLFFHALPHTHHIVTMSPTHSPRWPGFLIALMWLFIWLIPLGTRVLVSADEGRYAALSLGMLQSGDWLTPRLNGVLYFFKPPLQYWGGALAMAALGVNEFAARLYPALSGLFTVAITGWTAYRCWGPRAGRHAAYITGSCTWVVLNSHFLSLDMGLTAALSLTLCGVVMAYGAAPAGSQSVKNHRTGWLLAAWAGMGLAVMSKGLVGLMIPGAVWLFTVLLRREQRSWREMPWLWGMLILLVITAPWLMLMSAHHPSFAWFFFVHEHLERYLSPVHHREGPWWYFIPIVLIGFMPWTSALPRLLRWPKRPEQRDFVGIWLWVWVWFIVLFFSASSSKLPSYVLPIFPALALVLARVLSDPAHAGHLSPAQQGQSKRLTQHLLAPFMVWLLLGLAATQWEHRSDPAESQLATGLMVGAAVFAVACLIAWRLLKREHITKAMAVVAVAHTTATLIALQSHDGFGQIKSSAQMVKALQPHITSETPVFAVRSYEQTLPFYLGRNVTLVDYADEFAFGLQQEPQKRIATLAAFAKRWEREPQAAAYVSSEALTALRQLGVPMQEVLTTPRGSMVVKP
jgi:4-amino-4-deoxy-L-arabinose transferase-like glycosyltransferase